MRRALIPGHHNNTSCKGTKKTVCSAHKDVHDPSSRPPLTQSYTDQRGNYTLPLIIIIIVVIAHSVNVQSRPITE